MQENNYFVNSYDKADSCLLQAGVIRYIRKFVNSYGEADSCLLQAGVIRYIRKFVDS